MHPIERLRQVARAGPESPTMLAYEAASALAAIAGDHAALVMACRRLLDRQPAAGTLWWLAARVLAAPDAASAAREAGEELAADPTVDELAAVLPADGTVVVVGWPELVVGALHERPDVRVLVVGDGRGHRSLAGWLTHQGSDADAVPAVALGLAARAADVVLVEALAASADGVVAATGSRPAAAVATDTGVAVWAVAGVGRVLPPALWTALTASLEADPPWSGPDEVVPERLVAEVVGPRGCEAPAAALGRAGCPPVPELASYVARRP